MNCKQGDLAIVVQSRGGVNDGMVVRCIRLMGHFHGWENVWETDSALRWAHPFQGEANECAAPDECLRPIRGDLLDNETEQEKEFAHVR